MQSVPIEERLELVRFKVDKTPHIRLNREKCIGCDTTACIYVCPAGLFELLGEKCTSRMSIALSVGRAMLLVIERQLSGSIHAEAGA
jgi:ferredoxin like protein